MVPPVRRAKLSPPAVAAGHLKRPRLVERIARFAADRKLVVVVGPAGFGKTTLLAEWHAANAGPAAWVTIDPRDADPRRLAGQLVQAVRGLQPDFGADVLAELDRLASTPTTLGLAMAESFDELPERIALVLDDVHDAQCPALSEFFVALLRLPTDNVCLVMSCRTDPGLPLARMRATGSLGEVRAADLRFTPEETRALFRLNRGVEPDAAVVDWIHAHAEGWPAVVRAFVATCGPSGDEAQIVASFSPGERRHVLDFLLEEVLAQQPERVQAFLLKTSIVERFCPGLATALLDDGWNDAAVGDVIDGLLHADLFVSQIGRSGWYRYHPLFAELLRHRQRAAFSPADRAALHARAGAWFAAQGFVDRAIDQFLAADRPAAAAAIVADRAHEALDAERWPDLDRWLRRLPEAGVEASPRLLLARGWVAQLGGRFASIRPDVHRVEDLLANGAVADGDAGAVAGEALALAVVDRALETSPEGHVDDARRAFASIPPDHRFARGFALMLLVSSLTAAGRTDEARALARREIGAGSGRPDAYTLRGMMALALHHLKSGHLYHCEETATQIVALATGARLAVSEAWGRYLLGIVALDQDRIDDAATHFRAVLALQDRAHLVAVRESSFGLALCHLAAGSGEQASADIDRLTDFVLGAGITEFLPAIASFRARLALCLGQTTAAVRWLDHGDSAGGRELMWFVESIQLTRLRVLIAQRAPDSLEEAVRLARTLADQCERAGNRVRVVELKALEAAAHAARGAAADAGRCLDDALRDGAEGGFVRPFVDLCCVLRPLAEGDASVGGAGFAAAAVMHRLRRDVPGAVRRCLAQAEDARHPAGATGDLTDREQQVLEMLQQRKSNQEISEELFISPLTVKRHASNIYEKLGVQGRRHAVARAIDLGILSGRRPSA